MPLLAPMLIAAAFSASQDSVPLYTNLGDHNFSISSTVPKTQAYFNQGMRLVYAFNHAEAIRAFTEAARHHPQCAICWWGVALAHGPNINLPMDSANGAAAWVAIQKARSLMRYANDLERAYIDALTQRYGADPLKDRAQRDSAYARAMRSVARVPPPDADAITLAAEAAMNLRPWNYWQPDGKPYPGTRELVASLEHAMLMNPKHPGACHYYIHAVETVAPEKAVRCAEKLASLMPGAGHLVHMPAHIYIRVGRWDDAIAANKHAVHADQTYIQDQRPGGFYPVLYYPHNWHFLAFAATMAGRSAEAIEAARNVRQNIPVEPAAGILDLQNLYVYPFFTLVSFGRWQQVLQEPLPPSELKLARALASYARGVAQAALGNQGAAQTELAHVAAAVTTIAEGTFRTVTEIASHALTGEIAARANNLAEAEAHFRAAMKLEDSLPYMEPPHWYYPVRHSLGAVLLQMGRAADAEALYRADLERFPRNGWALHGLAQALHAQNKRGDAAKVEKQLQAVWKNSDVKLATSRY